MTSCQKKKEKEIPFDVKAFYGNWLQTSEKKINSIEDINNLKVITIKPDLGLIEYVLSESPYESNIPPELLSQENYFANITTKENNKLYISSKKAKELRDLGWSEEQISTEHQKANLITLSLNSDGTLTQRIKPFIGNSNSDSKMITYMKIDDPSLIKLKYDKLQMALDHYLERAPLLDLVVGHKFELLESIIQQTVDGKITETVTKASHLRDEKPVMKNDKVYITVSAKSLEFKSPKNTLIINNRYAAQFYFIQSVGSSMIIQFSHENEKILNNTYGTIKETPDGIDITNTEDDQITLWKYKRIF